MHTFDPYRGEIGDASGVTGCSKARNLGFYDQ